MPVAVGRCQGRVRRGPGPVVDGRCQGPSFTRGGERTPSGARRRRHGETERRCRARPGGYASRSRAASSARNSSRSPPRRQHVEHRAQRGALIHSSTGSGPWQHLKVGRLPRVDAAPQAAEQFEVFLGLRDDVWRFISPRRSRQRGDAHSSRRMTWLGASKLPGMLNASRPPGARASTQPGSNLRWLGHPLERRVGEDHVNRPVRRPCGEVPDREPQPRAPLHSTTLRSFRRPAEHLAGFGDHLLGAVDALDDRAGPAGGQVCGAFARTAAQIDHVGRGFDVDAGQKLEERPGAFGGIRPVLSWVPNIS